MATMPKLAFAIFLAAIAVPGQALAQSCGPYIILGCFKARADAVARMDLLGGPRIGGAGVAGSLGTQVIRTDEFPGFRDGYYCVADGPYDTRADAESIAWTEAVPDAYVKSGC